MEAKNKRRSNSVENQEKDAAFESNRKMYKSQSTENLKGGSKYQNVKGKSSVLNRPGTIAALSALSMGGFSQTISANALRNAHTHWSFSKADRFKKLRIDNSAKMLLLPTTLGTKTSTFGFGNRDPLKMIYGKDSPPPNLYRCRSQFDYTPGAGKSFGQSYAVYKKVHMPGLNTRSDEVPGPGGYFKTEGKFIFLTKLGKYDIHSTLGKNSRKFSMKSRIKPADSATRDNPPPNTYHPDFTQAEESRFDKITFGFGSRPNVTGRINENPGPGTYRIPSVFDKFKNIPNVSLLNTLEKYRNQSRRKIISKRGSSKQTGKDDQEPKDKEPLAILNDEENRSESKKGNDDKEERQSVSNEENSQE